MKDNLIDCNIQQRCYPEYDPIKEEQKKIDDINNLIQEGYDETILLRVYIYLKPDSFEEAKEYMKVENGKYKHKFIANKQKLNICVICNKGEDSHYLNYKNKSESLSANVSINNNKRELCMICSNELSIEEIEKNKIQCGHLFCDTCWYTYLNSRIKKAKIPYVKCIYYKCDNILSDNELIKLIQGDQQLIQHFESFKQRREILNDPNKKFCPHMNCDSFLEKNNNSTLSTCGNHHTFCYRCLENHNDTKCERDEYGKDFQLWKEGKTIRRCPICNYYNEKKKGINYIICSQCNYKWCWLCNEEYKDDHYQNGKCREITIIKPKINNCCSCCCIKDCKYTDWSSKFVTKYILYSILCFFTIIFSAFIGAPGLLIYYTVGEMAYFEEFDSVPMKYPMVYVVIFGAVSLCIGLLIQGLFCCVVSLVFCLTLVIPCINPFYLVWLFLRKEQRIHHY